MLFSSGLDVRRLTQPLTSSPMKTLAQILLVSGTLFGLSLPVRAALPIQHWVASSGARVYFVASPGIPMLDVNIDVDAGSRHDPAGKSGLAELTAGLLDAGALAKVGTHKIAAPLPAQRLAALNESQIADALADTGAQFSSSASADRSSIRLRTLSTPAIRDTALNIMARLLQEPAFPEPILAREKQRAVAALREAETKPEVMADHAFSQALYGPHPYGVTASVASVRAIKRVDLLRFYQSHYQASQATVTLIGAIDRKTAEEIAERLTQHLPKGGVSGTALPEVQAVAQAREIRLPHPALQAHVLMGQIGIARGDPDYFALLVGNHVLGGGGFVSRLTNEVREKRGLSYSVYSYFLPAAQPGLFQIGLQTQKAQVGQALAVVRKTVARFVEEGPNAAELQAAQDNLVNGFPLRIDNNRKLLDNIANIAWYGLPLDYLDTWTERVRAVTLEQVRAAFRKHVRPDALVTVVVGDAS